jgi:hypothetical protein
MRADAKYWGRGHYMTARRASEGGEGPARAHITRTPHPLQTVRDGQEATEGGNHWSAIVHEAILGQLRTHGRASANDLEPLGVPDAHRNCIGSQFGSLTARGYIEEIGREKSANPKRKAAKVSIYQFTPTGREKFAGLGVDARDSRKESLLDPLAVGVSAEPGGHPSARAGGTVPSTPGPVNLSTGSGGSGQLFDFADARDRAMGNA